MSAQPCTCTVAILAQGTSWAVAVTQAFFVAPCIAVVWLRVVGSVLRFGVAARSLRGSRRVCVTIWLRRLAVFGVLWCALLLRVSQGVVPGRLVKLAAVDVGSRSQAGCLKRNTAMDDSIGGS